MKRAAVSATVVAGAFLLLAIPVPEPSPPAPGPGAPFTWNRDTLWHELEVVYAGVRGAGCAATEPGLAGRRTRLATLLDGLAAGAPRSAGDPGFDSLETEFFSLGSLVAACPAHLREYVVLSGRLRDVVKGQSRQWDMDDRGVRERLYRSLYGTRAAVEEVMLQRPDSAPALLLGRQEPSATPRTLVQGVEIHSGDILVSRGGYPTSALIARGNDYPGNFSHIGLVHVDSTGAASVIEAHIEAGVAVSTPEAYLADRKLRIMVLRPRADLPQVMADPMLAHRAASRALARARAGHVPYDFAMDYTDPSRLFCSEVASSVYAERGVALWTGLSTISRAGLRRWLWSLGVRHFETQEPSDLEYDPQLVVVAEWRDPAALLQDHMDNAVLDVMLDAADSGEALDYGWYRLPFARLAKAYSWVRVQLGGRGPIPEGMSAAAALRHEAFVDRQREIVGRVRSAVERRTTAEGYPPPYWSLVSLAAEGRARPTPRP